ncbi:alpha/beta-hydrolase [Zopfia rhizophila CBS 207.26]|uniref:Alpha/beta-hydrolase n=1 Tax=Zopfia rhizophila CBS 207.26 TaxID=1314779 RepID=A0A6A6DHQ0_9PEZI|nr:alpha/beta-hydrolase [Zopfia rhizophila CBS 207.26]
MFRPRRILFLQAAILRKMMDFGMFLHRLSAPRPLSPSFRRSIPTTVSPRKGTIQLLFYTPPSYPTPPRSYSASRYPVLVSFHGGGFTIGDASDDARWAAAVVDIVGAVVVCVNYRLAPKWYFPTAIEDGVDAILYLIQNAEELSIDAQRIGVSGFSSGGTMAFTVPLILHDVLRRTEDQAPALASSPRSDGKIVVIMSWYPPTDFVTHTRTERRRTNIRPETELPRFLTELFDASYLYPPRNVSLSHPYLSPGVAPDEMLRELPYDVIIFTCEWDGLRAEAEAFRDRLSGPIGKRVCYKVVKGVRHAWDKSPNPFKRSPTRELAYREACVELKRILEGQ